MITVLWQLICCQDSTKIEILAASCFGAASRPAHRTHGRHPPTPTATTTTPTATPTTPTPTLTSPTPAPAPVPAPVGNNFPVTG
jgi:hypothetical protein